MNGALVVAGESEQSGPSPIASSSINGYRRLLRTSLRRIMRKVSRLPSQKAGTDRKPVVRSISDKHEDVRLKKNFFLIIDSELLENMSHHPGSHVPLTHSDAILKTLGPNSKIFSLNFFSREKGSSLSPPCKSLNYKQAKAV